MIYFDNSATTRHKPVEVIEAVTTCLKEYSANPGRSGHNLSLKAACLIQDARISLAEFVNAPDSDKVIFTKNCTEALNLAIFSGIKKGSHIITTVHNHNSVLRPLYILQKQGFIELSVLTPDENNSYKCKIPAAIRQNTRMICLNHVCNVTGKTLDLNQITCNIKNKNIKILLDSAQSAGYIDIDMQAMGIDYLAVAPHKGLHSIQGLGALILNNRAQLYSPLIFGGTGTRSESLEQPLDYPEGFEAGTINTPAIAALNASILWNKKNKHNMRQHLDALYSLLEYELKQLDFIKLYSEKNSSGIFSFTVNNAASSKISDYLNSDFDIAVRGGLHCAPLIHRYLQTTDIGLVRVSLGIDNTKDDIEKLITALIEINKRI